MAAAVVAFAAGMVSNAVIFRLGADKPAASVVIGQRLVRPAPPARTATPTPTTVPTASLAWSRPVIVEGSYAPQSVSCATAGFCAVVDNHGQALLYQDAHWTAPASIDGTVQINSVSCANASFCMAVDQEGNAMTYTGTGWSRPTRVDRSTFPDLTSVSCASTTFCAAVDGNGNALVFDGKSWSAPQQVDPQAWTKTSRDVPSLSCPADGFCVGIDPRGSAFYYVGDSWQVASSLEPSAGAAPTARLKNSVSCASSTSCVATENLGGIATYNGSEWSFPVVVDPGNYISSVSCPAANFCAAVDGLLPQGFNSGNGSGELFVYNGFTWSSPSSIDGGAVIQSVSCATSGFCIAVDQSGHAIIGTTAQRFRTPRAG